MTLWCDQLVSNWVVIPLHCAIAFMNPALSVAANLSQGDDEVLFHLPVIKNWLFQLMLGLVLLCHSRDVDVVPVRSNSFPREDSQGWSVVERKGQLWSREILLIS